MSIKEKKRLIKEKLRAEVIETRDTAHQGVNGMMANARQRIFWHGLNTSIRQTRAQHWICLHNHQDSAQSTPNVKPITSVENVIWCRQTNTLDEWKYPCSHRGRLKRYKMTCDIDFARTSTRIALMDIVASTRLYCTGHADTLEQTQPGCHQLRCYTTAHS